MPKKPSKPSRPRPPAGLGNPGKTLWRSILGDIAADWEFDAREFHLLKRACRCADELKKLEDAVDRDSETVEGSRGQVVVHPALSEARQLRLVQLRLLSAIELVDPKDALKSATPGQARARRAAESRWVPRG